MQPHVERHDDGAGQRNSVITFEEGVAIEAEDADAICWTDAVGDEACGDAATAVSELGVGVASVACDHGYLVGVEIQRAEEAANRREWNVHSVSLGFGTRRRGKAAA
jgi:hypothetical protein